MGKNDGSVVGVTKILDQGADSSQWNLVMMGDGYTATQQGGFESNVDSFVAILASMSPFSSIWQRVNVHRVEVRSDETGADNPATCADNTLPWDGVATVAATYFDAAYCTDGLRRRLTVDTGLVMETADAWVPNWDVVVVLVNHQEEGGSGDSGVAVGSSPTLWSDQLFHELGHSAFNLADEYDFLEGCDSGETTQDDYLQYSTLEPPEPNVTIDPAAAPKWGGLIDPGTPTPTTTNPDPTECDTQASPVPEGTIGTFEGAAYFHSGVYRPAYTCKMRYHADDSCGVCSNVITAILLDNPCFLATRVYGDPFAPEVVTLRAWRDRHLAPGARGAALS